ncbi:hypothetical protein FQN49_000893 [Arthroderma sp. PD_2]|nr:hypothetical protein FQN49_000893 [Arthroderma sp. PD_2]
MGPKYMMGLILLLQAVYAISPTVVTVYVTPSPQPIPPTDISGNQFKNGILGTSNRYRAEHNATDLIWNNTLAHIALKWAKKCKWKHSGSGPGENLAYGYTNASSAIEAWGGERDIYNFKKPTGFSKQTGHFTQLVWKGTTSLGCGMVKCNLSPGDRSEDHEVDGWYFVCEYWPPGNVVSTAGDLFRANVQPACHGENKASNASHIRGFQLLRLAVISFTMLVGLGIVL